LPEEIAMERMNGDMEPTLPGPGETAHDIGSAPGRVEPGRRAAARPPSRPKPKAKPKTKARTATQRAAKSPGKAKARGKAKGRAKASRTKRTGRKRR
jgi:hypothetical protein